MKRIIKGWLFGHIILMAVIAISGNVYSQCDAVPGNAAFSCSFSQGGARTGQFTSTCVNDFTLSGGVYQVTTACYGFAIGNSDTYQIDNDVTIIGNVVIDLNQMGSLFEILNGVTFTVTGNLTIIGNSNQVRQLTVDGVLNIGGTLDFGERGGGVDNTVLLGGSGSISADAIINAGNTGCSNDPCDVSISANTCDDGAGSFCDNQVTLPINLLSFEVKEKNSIVEITWVTASELNNDFFTLEKSIDARNFNVIAQIDGAGNSSTMLTYIYEDLNPRCSGQSYYRLTQTDFDGTSETFKPVGVYYTALDKNSLIISPNPTLAGSEVGIFTSAKHDEQLLVEFYNSNGELVDRQVTSGANSTLSLEKSILPGLYFIKVTSGHVSKSAKLLVQ